MAANTTQATNGVQSAPPAPTYQQPVQGNNGLRTKAAICSALGIDITRVARLTIILDEGLPRAEIIYMIHDDQVESLVGSVGGRPVTPS